MRRLLFVLMPVAIVGTALIVGLSGGPAHGRAAPPLPRSVLSGSRVAVSGLRGQPALIDFFASWCGPCTLEAPRLRRVAQLLSGRARVVAVDWSDSRRYGLAFVRRFGWRFAVLSDPNGAAGYAYGVQGLPTAVVLDARGRVVRRLVGPQTVAEFVRAVETAGAPGRSS